MLHTLLAKDLRRATRNPVPWLISLIVPFFITGLLGAIFSPRQGSGQLGTIHVALVDEDNTGLGEFLTGMLEQTRTSGSRADAPFQLDLALLPRKEAVDRTTWGEFSAVVVLPEGFTEGYFDTGEPVAIEVIKNPAQGVHPRIVEEAVGLLVTAMNALRDVAGDQLGDIRDLLSDEEDDVLTKLALGGAILVRARERLEPVRAYLSPPLIQYTEQERADTTPKPAGSGRDVFPYLVAGMAAMFLLYLIDNAMRDLYRELRARTLERFQTVHEGLAAFITGKVCFGIAMGLIGAVILMGGSALVFQFAWRAPLELTAMVFVYSFAGAGLLGLIAALAGSERRADNLANLMIMGMAMLGGCMFPPSSFPAFLREWILPLMPPGWFAAAVRSLQAGEGPAVWITAFVKLAVLGVITIAVASVLFRRRIAQGVRV